MKSPIFRKLISILLLIAFLTLSFSFQFNTGINKAADIKTAYRVNNYYSGFKLLSLKEMPEQNSTAMLFSHEKTGARLMFIKNSDNERTFSIAFRTPATDDTGVNHIIEHSVLNGSRNYPVKSPFEEMLKRSLGTFINAMTANDYTIYPVSSVNDKDLQNLMSIYLDAVFYPNLNSDPNIFKQEAWRYELDSRDSRLNINGVIYNEMKGYYSNPSYILEREIYGSLFPDTSYRWDAGGNPEAIPALTYESFKAVYNKYYIPSNSYIFLYGNLDINQYLELIDKNYLSKMSKAETATALTVQKPFEKMVEKSSFYPVPENSDAKKKTYMSMNFVTGNMSDKDLTVGLDYLSYLLMGSDNSPLYKALSDSGIADSYTCSFRQDSQQPVFSVTAENIDEASKEAFKKIIFDTLSQTVQAGFDKELVRCIFSQYDLKKGLDRISAKRGLSINFNVMEPWLYDEDPSLYLDTSDSIARIKKLSENRYFENLIDKYLLGNNHSSLVILKPSPGMESKNEQALRKSLQDYKSKLDLKEVTNLVEETGEFKAWQVKPDTIQALQSIPRLSLKDIKADVPDLSFKVSKLSGVDLISHSTQLNGISSVRLYFDTSRVPQDKLHYLNLLTALLGNIDTKKYKIEDLTNEILLFSSGISFTARSAVDARHPDKYRPLIAASFLSLNDNIPASLDLLEEIIDNTVFENKSRIKQLIRLSKLNMYHKYTSGEGTFSNLKYNAYLSESGRYMDQLSGPGYYNFLKNLDSNFDSNWKEISANLKEVYSLAFSRNNLVVGFSGDRRGQEIFNEELQKILPEFRTAPPLNIGYNFTLPEKNLALPLPVKVQTLLKGGSFTKEGFSYSGKMLVLQRILNMEYLWKNIRVSGGAYGVSAAFSRSGSVTFMSMRDPNLSETLKIFDGSAEYLKNFTAGDSEMENFIVGTLSEFLKIRSKGPIYEGTFCDSLYLTGLTADDIKNTMQEALSTKAEDIRNYSEMVQKIIDQNIYYVEGSADKINENKTLFTQLESIEK